MELRGGAVLFEPGAVSGSFIGVFFLQEQDSEVSRFSITSQNLYLPALSVGL